MKNTRGTEKIQKFKIRPPLLYVRTRTVVGIQICTTLLALGQPQSDRRVEGVFYARAGDRQIVRNTSNVKPNVGYCGPTYHWRARVS